MTTSQRENYISEKHKNFDRRYKQIQVNQKKDHQPEKALLLNSPQLNNKPEHAALHEHTA